LAVGAGVAGLAGVSPQLLRAAWQGKSPRNSYTASNLALELDGVMAGFIPLSGLDTQTGSASSATTVRQIGAIVASVSAAKALGIAPVIAPTTPQTAQVTFCFGNGLSQNFYSWLQQGLANQAPRKNGTLYFVDYNFTPQMSLEWTGGSISEFDFPALDASQKAAAVLTMTVKAVSLIEKTLNGASKITGPSYHIGTAQKKMLVSNFGLSSASFPNSLNYVHRVDAITLVPATRAGTLTFALPLSKADVFFQAFQATQAAPSQPKPTPPVGIQRSVAAIPQAPSLQIDVLSENMQLVLLSLILQNVAVSGIETPKLDSTDKIPIARIKMSYQDYQLQFGNSVWA
jgi:hypothetical protein